MTTGMLFDIQHYAVHDGPGIRTLVFLKGCPLRCAWCSNPESQHRGRELRHARARCQACGRCAQACTAGAVVLGTDGPAFDRRRCAACERRACVDACPHDALTCSGFEATVADVARRVGADRPFYRNSGGGVTFSGGEPLAQPEFLCAALRACRELGIHTAVETSGHAAPELLGAALPLVDLWLYDLKLADPAAHRAATGHDNALLLDNLARLCAEARDRVVGRVPLVPAATDSLANLTALGALAARLGISRVELVPYHPYGDEKVEELGRAAERRHRPALDPATIERAFRLFRDQGLGCELA